MQTEKAEAGCWKFEPLKGLAAQANRHEAVEQYLLQKIISGEIPQGLKLPPTAEIAAQMELDLKSVQKALMRLSARGFLTRKQSFGTVVSYQGDSSANVFILIGPCLREEPHHFDRKLSKMLEAELLARGYNPVIYDDLEQTLDGKSRLGRRLTNRLIADFAHFDPVAVIEQDFSQLRTPELLQGGKGRVVVSFRPEGTESDVSFDFEQCIAEGLKAIAERGRKNLVLVQNRCRSYAGTHYLKAFWKVVDSLGINVAKILHVSGKQASTGEISLQKVLSEEIREWKALPPRKRPDAILFVDDIFTRAGAQCLLQEGIVVPDDVLVVSWVNEGIDLQFGVPVTGVEYSAQLAASRLIDILDIRLGRATGRDPAPVSLPGRVIEVKPMAEDVSLVLSDETEEPISSFS